ncbi:hypothetical protein [Candidatus Protochlamydia amoebophila]|uniref:hypothetical protein n=1 Tax=Candidatus Protochlamydia amoebophila TaxID=362787 RepID=UPI001BC8E87A|nr:hypothetical protein [Candidatus Protochlamydia amoebophila]
MQSTLSGQLFPSNQRFVEKIFVLSKQFYQIDVPIKNPLTQLYLPLKIIFFIQNKSCSTNFSSSKSPVIFFAALRTKQQTGYLVFNTAEVFNQRLFMFFAVQSNTHDPQDLLFRFELFLEDFLTDMGQIALNQSNFEKIKNALLENLTIPLQICKIGKTF